MFLVLSMTIKYLPELQLALTASGAVPVAERSVLSVDNSAVAASNVDNLPGTSSCHCCTAGFVDPSTAVAFAEAAAIAALQPVGSSTSSYLPARRKKIVFFNHHFETTITETTITESKL